MPLNTSQEVRNINICKYRLAFGNNICKHRPVFFFKNITYLVYQTNGVRKYKGHCLRLKES